MGTNGQVKILFWSIKNSTEVLGVNNILSDSKLKAYSGHLL